MRKNKMGVTSRPTADHAGVTLHEMSTSDFQAWLEDMDTITESNQINNEVPTELSCPGYTPVLGMGDILGVGDLSACELGDLSEPPPLLTGAEKCHVYQRFESLKTLAVVAFDWAQFTAKILSGFGAKTDGLWSVERPNPNGDLFLVWYNHECVARIASLAGKNQAGMVSVTLENKFCYQPDLPGFIQYMCESVGIAFRNYTRLDVSMDFQRTDYRGVSPQLFMDRVAKGNYIMKGKKIRVYKEDIEMDFEGDDRIYLHEVTKRKNVDTVAGARIVKGKQGVETITWGKRKSGMAITMYNKTLEMKRKKDKPYIREIWIDAGFDMSCNVYRLEFSSPRTTTPLHEVDLNGEITGVFDFTDLFITTCPERYFKAVYARHFKLAIHKEGVRFERLKKVELFKIEKMPFAVPVRVSEKSASNNYVKNKIKTTIADLPVIELTNEVVAESLHTYIELQVVKYDLHKWLNRKFPEYKCKPNKWEQFNAIGKGKDAFGIMNELQQKTRQLCALDQGKLRLS